MVDAIQEFLYEIGRADEIREFFELGMHSIGHLKRTYADQIIKGVLIGIVGSSLYLRYILKMADAQGNEPIKIPFKNTFYTYTPFLGEVLDKFSEIPYFKKFRWEQPAKKGYAHFQFKHRWRRYSGGIIVNNYGVPFSERGVEIRFFGRQPDKNLEYKIRKTITTNF